MYISVGWIDQKLGQNADNDQEGHPENEHGLAQAEPVDEPGAQGCYINGSQPESRHHNTGDHPGFGRGKPFDGRRRGRCIPEPQARAHEDPESQDPDDPGGEKCNENQTGAREHTAHDGGHFRAGFVLNPAGQDHGKGKHQAAHGIWVIQGGQAPVETSVPCHNGFFDGFFENTPCV
ncbi:MAG: hypothetical protein U5J62_07425 [Desulfurivibrio sp.]|nr:hypothetical protein [Desulfurivibrio sp.]